MTVVEYITQILGHEWNLAELDSDNTDRRTRLLEFLTQLVQRIWYAKSWPWRRNVATVSILQNASEANLPTDFLSIGDRRYGGVWRSADGHPLEPIPEWRLRDIRENPGNGSEIEPEAYSIFGQDAATYRYKIQVPLIATSAYNLRVAYETIPPTLDESSNSANLNKIPAQYHQSCLIPPGRAFARRAFGAQDSDVDAEIEKAIRRIADAERPGADGPAQLPEFDGGWS